VLEILPRACPVGGRAMLIGTVAWGRRELRRVNGSLSRVARLIHLNGPPGIGKSTVASAFADRHPGVLNLDIDRVTALVGGCRGRFSESFAAGVLLATAMARVHLGSGHDVILPQMMTDVNAGEMAVFESSAAAAEAEYCQILLTASVESAVERCMERAKAPDARQDAVSKVIEDNGGSHFVRKLYAQVTEFSAGRQPYAVIDCEQLTIEQTCQAVEAALVT
jgi:predicted kinase